MKSILHHAALTGLLAFTFAPSAEAAVYVDNWQFGGSDWESNYAPNPASSSAASLAISGYDGGLDVGIGLYTLFASPQFSLTTGNFDSDTTTISLAVASTTAPLSVLLNFNAANPALANYSLTTTDLGVVESGGFSAQLYEYLYTWDVSGLDESEGLDITWSLGNHSVISGATLSQVPEVSSAALAALALTTSLLRRRR